MTQAQDAQWYIVQQVNGQCEIQAHSVTPQDQTTWGPYESKQAAIAKRVGLIRAGKCQPM